MITSRRKAVLDPVVGTSGGSTASVSFRYLRTRYRSPPTSRGRPEAHEAPTGIREGALKAKQLVRGGQDRRLLPFQEFHELDGSAGLHGPGVHTAHRQSRIQPGQRLLAHQPAEEPPDPSARS